MSTSEYTVPGLTPARRGGLDTVRSVPVELWILGSLVLLAAVIRMLTIDNQSIWSDEALTAYEAQLPLGAMIHTVATVETTPPLYFALTWLSVHIFGHGDVPLRLVSLLAGIAIVPIAYLSGSELLSRRAGVLAAGLAALSPCLVWYSQEARAYMLLCTLSAASFLWFLRARRDPSTRHLAWWAACSVLAVMTHFFAGFVVAPEAVGLICLSRRRGVLLAVGAVAVVQLAMLPLAFVDTGHGPGWIAASSPRLWRLDEVPLEFGLATMYRVYTRTAGLIGGLGLLALCAGLGWLARERRLRRGIALAAAIGGAGVLAPLILGMVGPDYFLARNVLPAWLPLEIAIVGACSVTRLRVLGAGLAAILLAFFAFATVRTQTDGALQRPNWRELADAIGPASSARAIISAGGAAADPIKIYLPHVRWGERHTVQTWIDEVDVIGAKRAESVLPWHASSYSLPDGLPVPAKRGVASPRVVAPPGTELLGRFRVGGWTVARFRLARPTRLDINELIAMTPRFFGRAPTNLLVFFQQAGH